MFTIIKYPNPLFYFNIGSFRLAAHNLVLEKLKRERIRERRPATLSVPVTSSRPSMKKNAGWSYLFSTQKRTPFSLIMPQSVCCSIVTANGRSENTHQQEYHYTFHSTCSMEHRSPLTFRCLGQSRLKKK